MTKKEDESIQAGGHEEHDMSARRARLRTSLAKQGASLDIAKSETGELNPINYEAELESRKEQNSAQFIENVGKSISNDQVSSQFESVALLGHIDQALNSCAGHLASLQEAANKQTAELRAIAETLQNRVINQSAQSLSPLLESLTAAIEPMKALGELVPVLDRLANATERKDQNKEEIGNDALVISLAEQLFTGNIDSLTFKSAYQALFPDVDPVHRLGELLDSQQLSGELFQAAFQALQSNEFVYDVAPIDQQSALDEEVKKEFLIREEELSRQLVEKDQEIQNMRQQLDSQWHELASQCEELKVILQNRDEVLAEKETELGKKIGELSAKDSENQQLKAQIEELKDKTKEMMTDLQRQLAKKQEEDTLRKQLEESAKKQQEQADKNVPNLSANPQSGFFDFVSTPNTTNTLFNSESPALFPTESDINIASSAMDMEQKVKVASDAPGWQKVDVKPLGGVAVPDHNMQEVSSPAAFKTASASALANDPQKNTQASASFVSAVGSYGSGVRAQVFEVIVRQALAGTQWREICAVPMQSNNISPQEVEIEVKRRQALLKK